MYFFELCLFKRIRRNSYFTGDTDGSVEALLNVLNTYDKHSECRLDVMHFGVGPVTKNDLEMAKTFKGIVYAMHVGLSPDLKAADSANVKIKEFKVRNGLYSASGLWRPRILMLVYSVSSNS